MKESGLLKENSFYRSLFGMGFSIDRGDDKIKVLSIAHGFKAQTEIQALDACLRCPYQYTGIEIEPTKIKYYKDNPIDSLYADAEFFLANAAETETLDSLEDASFDLVILRHPNFNEQADSFRLILRSTIPRKLKKGAQLIISVYADQERETFIENKKNLDGILMQILYEHKKTFLNDYLDLEISHLEIDKATPYAKDRWTMLFKNTIDFNAEPLQRYSIILGGLPRESIIRIIDRLGGKQIKKGSQIYEIREVYANRANQFCKSTFDQSILRRAVVAVPEIFTASPKSVREMKRKLEKITKELFTGWKYSQASNKFWIKATYKNALKMQNYFTSALLENGYSSLTEEVKLNQIKGQSTGKCYVVSLPCAICNIDFEEIQQIFLSLSQLSK